MKPTGEHNHMFGSLGRMSAEFLACTSRAKKYHIHNIGGIEPPFGVMGLCFECSLPSYTVLNEDISHKTPATFVSFWPIPCPSSSKWE